MNSGNVKLTLALGACGIAGAGLLSQAYLGNDLFMRSGALIVSFGVIMAGREITNTEAAMVRHETRMERLEAAYLDVASTPDAEISPETFSRLAKSLGEFRTDRTAKVKELVRLEILTVCLGTVIWGFGDLLFSSGADGGIS